MKTRMLVLYIDTPVDDGLVERLLEAMRSVASVSVEKEQIRAEEWDR